MRALTNMRDKEGHKLMCAVEKVGAMPGQGVTSMFSFGQSYGFVWGVLTALGIGYQLVPPTLWKREFGLLHTEKQGSVDVAKRLFPGVSLLPTDRCRKDSDGMSDALLIAEYARRKF
jgi:crossover junction endodeoxyribonuclease RuvC